MADITPNAHLPERTLIKQPVTQDLRVEQGMLQLTEKWKGRYEHCRSVLSALYSADNVHYAAFAAAAGTLSAAYATPAPPQDLSWKLAQATVDELDAGENGVLLAVWNAAPAAPASPSADVPSQTTWNLQWQPENYSVYAYCKNPEEHQSDASGGSQRVAVEQCLHPPLGNNAMTRKYLFMDNDGVVLYLNDNERKLAKWQLEGKRVIKHHPVLERVDNVPNVQYDYINQVLAGKSSLIRPPDKIDDPGQSPIPLTGWQWVSQGTNVQTTQPDVTKNEWNVTFTTQWIGSLSAETEFYGPNAWRFGEM